MSRYDTHLAALRAQAGDSAARMFLAIEEAKGLLAEADTLAERFNAQCPVANHPDGAFQVLPMLYADCTVEVGLRSEIDLEATVAAITAAGLTVTSINHLQVNDRLASYTLTLDGMSVTVQVFEYRFAEAA